MKRAASKRGSSFARVGGPALAVLLALMSGACGSDSPPTPCQQVGAALCNKACACTDGPGCNISSQDGFSITFDNAASCNTFLVNLACSDPSMPAYNDAVACLPLVQAATCTGTGTEAAVAAPTDPACASPPPPP